MQALIGHESRSLDNIAPFSPIFSNLEGTISGLTPIGAYFVSQRKIHDTPISFLGSKELLYILTTILVHPIGEANYANPSDASL